MKKILIVLLILVCLLAVDSIYIIWKTPCVVPFEAVDITSDPWGCNMLPITKIEKVMGGLNFQLQTLKSII